METRIVVLQRGFVAVGRVEYRGTEAMLHKPAIVRKWGTKDLGLGFLADNGPQPLTVLDRGSKSIIVERLAIIFQWQCDEEKWKGFFGG